MNVWRVHLRPDADVDPVELCIKQVEKGIGPAKAFGCGLMLVRRV